MRVVQINAIYGNKSTGTIVREIQSCCGNHGIECFVAYSITDRPYHDVPRGYHIGNVFWAKWAAFISRITGKQAYANHFSTYKLLRWLDDIHPDVIHLHNLHSNYIHLNMLLSYLAKRDIATVITMHDCWYFTGGCTHYTAVECERWKTGCGNCPQRKLLHSYFIDATSDVLKDRVQFLNAIPRLVMVGVSEWIRNEISKSKLGNLKKMYIHNGFDLSMFRPVRSDIRKQLGIGNQFVILGPANKWLLPTNRTTLNYFISNMEDEVLVLFGSYKDRLNLPANVIMLEYTNDPKKMAEIYSMADVMVNCSREDTLSSLNLESQACGTPVVTYDATGSKETVDEHCGFSVPTGDYKALWSKVLELKAYGKIVYSNSCREWIRYSFDKESNYNKYIQLYNNLMKLTDISKL